MIPGEKRWDNNVISSLFSQDRILWRQFLEFQYFIIFDFGTIHFYYLIHIRGFSINYSPWSSLEFTCPPYRNGEKLKGWAFKRYSVVW